MFGEQAAQAPVRAPVERGCRHADEQGTLADRDEFVPACTCLHAD